MGTREERELYALSVLQKIIKTKSVACVRERTIPIE
jgi:hypothetical protein